MGFDFTTKVVLQSGQSNQRQSQPFNSARARNLEFFVVFWVSQPGQIFSFMPLEYQQIVEKERGKTDFLKPPYFVHFARTKLKHYFILKHSKISKPSFEFFTKQTSTPSKLVQVANPSILLVYLQFQDFVKVEAVAVSLKGS